jgi:hypothetical protein
MNQERATRLAIELQKLNVGQAIIVELLSSYPLEQIERQLEYLPYRSPKRPAALLVEAVRYNYSAPKEFYYAQTQIEPAEAANPLDQGSKPPAGQDDAEHEGHRASSHLDPSSSDGRLEPGGPGRDLVLPDSDAPERPST